MTTLCRWRMSTEPKTISVEYHHEESGNCLATFRGIGKDSGRWFNKMTNGTWYYTYPAKGYYENSHEVKQPCIFQIYGKGLARAFAIDSNVPELAEKPYVFREEMLSRLKRKYLRMNENIEYDAWAKAMCDCKEFMAYEGYRDNFLHAEDEIVREEFIETVAWAGRFHNVMRTLFKNRISGRKYWTYFVRVRCVGTSVYEMDDYLTVYSFQGTNSSSKA